MKLNLKATLQQALIDAKITTFTPIQQQALPQILQHKNIMMKSPTGTGKTYAFVIPILNDIVIENETTQALIMAPTRELALQIHDVTKKLITGMDENITVTLAVGGKDRDKLKQLLQTKQPHILIGTPGRCEDMLAKEHLINTTTIKHLVLDEVDMIIENGFLESVDAVLSSIPEQPMVFTVCSATISQEIEQFVRKYIKNISIIEIKQQTQQHIQHLFLDVTGKDKLAYLYHATQIFRPYVCLIFANTKKQVTEIHQYLSDKGLKAGLIHGDMPARQRQQMLRRVHQLEFQYVVASDIAARGIDIDGVSHIINFEIPPLENLQFYFHRAGRTGRMEYDGMILSFFDKEERNKLQKIVKQGIEFNEVKLKDHAFVHHNDGAKTARQLDEQILQISQKAKKSAHRNNKIKPGYKRKIKWAVTDAIRKEKRKQNKGKKAGK